MASCVREFLQVTKESSYCVPKTSPVRGVDTICIRLDGDNKFGMRPKPVRVPVNYGGGYNVECDALSDKTEVKGALSTRLCYSQADILLGMLLTRINDAQTLPWPTDEPHCQFASICVDHGILDEDAGTIKRTRYLGVKADGGGVSVSEDSQEATLNLDLFASKYEGNPFDSSSDPTALQFPVPADDEYPRDYVQFSQSSMLLNGSAFVKYKSLDFTTANNHDSHFYNSRWITDLRSYGRKVTLNTDLKLVSTPDLRLALETLDPIAMQLTFTNTVNTLVLDFLDNALVEGLEDNLPMGTMYMRKLTMGSRYSEVGQDVIAFSVT